MFKKKLVRYFLDESPCSKTIILVFEQGDFLVKNLTSRETCWCGCMYKNQRRTPAIIFIKKILSTCLSKLHLLYRLGCATAKFFLKILVITFIITINIFIAMVIIIFIVIITMIIFVSFVLHTFFSYLIHRCLWSWGVLQWSENLSFWVISGNQCFNYFGNTLLKNKIV